MNLSVYPIGVNLNWKTEKCLCVEICIAARLFGIIGDYLCKHTKKKIYTLKTAVFIWFSLQRSVEFCSWVAKSKGKIRKEFC